MPRSPPRLTVCGVADLVALSRYVAGMKGTTELERLVRGERAWGTVAFCMFPVSVAEVMKVADQDGLMPPKATWFEPKLISGLLVRLLEDD
jgi:uncharacterized protein (DUF1015 family)